jgi:5-methylcytosine-specific restriction endonuclease McrA
MIKVACANCGKFLERHPYRIRDYRNQFCDRKCLGEYRSKHIRGSAHPRFANGGDIIEVTCSNCGKKIARHRSKIERNEHNFCSMKCFHEFGRPDMQGEKNPSYVSPVETKCTVCGKPITRQPNRVGKDKRNHHFCCLEHKYQWMRETFVGEKSWSWKGGKIPYYGPNWRAQKRKARKRDGYKCRACGITPKQYGHALDVHHIVPFRQFYYIPGENENYLQANKLDNLVTLCKSCHMLAENGSISFQPNLL